MLDTDSYISSNCQDADQDLSSYFPHSIPTPPLVPLDSSSQDTTNQDDTMQDGNAAKIPIEL